MQGKNHVALALAVPLASALVMPPGLLPVSFGGWAGLVIGSLAPDIDGEGSIAYWGNFLPRYVTPRIVVSLLNWLGQSVSGLIRSIFGHRNLFHWPVIGLGFAVAGSLLGLDWLLWFGLGYTLHIFGDSLTKSGVPLFGPIYQGDISFTTMVTGKWVESLFGVGLWLFVGFALVSRVDVQWINDILYIVFKTSFLYHLRDGDLVEHIRMGL